MIFSPFTFIVSMLPYFRSHSKQSITLSGCASALIKLSFQTSIVFASGPVDKESACNMKDSVLIPESGRSPGGGKGNPLQYSCLENSVGRGTWWAVARGVTKSQIISLSLWFETEREKEKERGTERKTEKERERNSIESVNQN